MTRPSARILIASAGCALLLAVGLACDGLAEPPSCDGGPEPGVVSLWTPCGVGSLSAASVPLTLTNDTDELIWIYHDCGDEVPWPVIQETDGTWQRLLPDDFFLSTGCEHVHEINPGITYDVPMSTRRATRPGTYRAEMMVARGCVDVHHPAHVPHSCDHLDFLLSPPFELR